MSTTTALTAERFAELLDELDGDEVNPSSNLRDSVNKPRRFAADNPDWREERRP